MCIYRQLLNFISHSIELSFAIIHLYIVFPETHPSVSTTELDLLIDEILASHEKGIIASSTRIEEVTWNIPTSIYFGVTVVTTIGR